MIVYLTLAMRGGEGVKEGGQYQNKSQHWKIPEQIILLQFTGLRDYLNC